jgi:hypothetical protein
MTNQQTAEAMRGIHQSAAEAHRTAARAHAWALEQPTQENAKDAAAATTHANEETRKALDADAETAQERGRSTVLQHQTEVAQDAAQDAAEETDDKHRRENANLTAHVFHEAIARAHQAEADGPAPQRGRRQEETATPRRTTATTAHRLIFATTKDRDDSRRFLEARGGPKPQPDIQPHLAHLFFSTEEETRTAGDAINEAIDGPEEETR